MVTITHAASMAVLEVLAGYANILKEIGNCSLQNAVAQPLEGVLEHYPSAQMTYDLSRLRLKGLIERIGKSHRYRLTDLGLKVVTLFTELYHSLYAPGFPALLPAQTLPSDLANVINQFADVLHAWMDSAFALPVWRDV